MPAIIDSAPSCITHLAGAAKGDDADFILQATYAKCEGIMTFGPGSTYGDASHGAAGGYYVLVVLGILVTIVALVAWVVTEHRRLTNHATSLAVAARTTPTAPPRA